MRGTGWGRTTPVPVVAGPGIGPVLGSILPRFSSDDIQTMWQLGYFYGIFQPPDVVEGGSGRHRGARQKRECAWDSRGNSAFARPSIRVRIVRGAVGRPGGWPWSASPSPRWP